VAAGALIFVASLGPVLGLTPFMFQYTSSVADHYLYLAMFGPALLATWAVVRYGRRGVMAGCALGLAVLGARSYQQLGWWHDDRAIWSHTMASCPDSFIAPTNLATAYGRDANALRVAGEDAREAGRIEEANWMMARQREQYVKAADLLEKALAVNPKSMAALHNAFMYNFRLGHYQRAVERLERLLAINDALPPAERTNFTALHDAAGNLWMKLGRFDKAAAEYERVLAASPENKDVAAELKEARQRSAEARVDEGDAIRR
jgi:tetratricopeptide (TPR) repeat protein